MREDAEFGELSEGYGGGCGGAGGEGRWWDIGRGVDEGVPLMVFLPPPEPYRIINIPYYMCKNLILKRDSEGERA